MKQVYLTEETETSFTKGIKASGLKTFSSHQKAVTYLTSLFPAARFHRLIDTTTAVDKDGSTVGWITKKHVQ